MALSLFLIPLGSFAAGSPMNESFTELIGLSNEAIEVGDKGDAKAFSEKVAATVAILKTQDEKGSSIRLQRASSKLKAGLKAAKAGRLPEGVVDVQQAVEIMQSAR
jgi:hypothetical protein